MIDEKRGNFFSPLYLTMNESQSDREWRIEEQEMLRGNCYLADNWKAPSGGLKRPLAAKRANIQFRLSCSIMYRNL